jgi:hypothetical protein
MTELVPDLSEFYRLSKPKKPPCKLGLLLSPAGKLSPQERVNLHAALATDNSIVTSKAIIERLEELKVKLEINTNNIVSHRGRKCTCEFPHT